MEDEDSFTRLMMRASREHVRVNDILEAPNPQRTFVDRDKLEELKQSIKREGLIQPIGVNRVGGTLKIIWGSRRLQAVKEIGWLSIDAAVFEDISYLDTLVLRINENLHQDKEYSSDIENDIYEAWKLYQPVHISKPHAPQTGASKDLGINEFASRFGIGPQKMQNIIKRVELRFDMARPEIQNAVPSDLDETNILAEWPEARLALLRGMGRSEDHKSSGPITSRSLRIAAQAVKYAPDEYKERLATMLEKGEIIAEEQVAGSKVIELAKTLKKVPKGVQEALLNQDLPLDEAVKPKTAKTPEMISKRVLSDYLEIYSQIWTLFTVEKLREVTNDKLRRQCIDVVKKVYRGSEGLLKELGEI